MRAMPMCVALSLLVGLAGCAERPAPAPAATVITTMTTEPSTPPPPSPNIPAKAEATTQVRTEPAPVIAAVRAVEHSATVGALVVDRETGAELLAVNADRQFRSASLVKLMMAIDVLAGDPDAATRQRIAVMIRLSDDD